ncbi:MAG: hypothetical protein EPN89_14195 [Methylovulum sp.]|nr:MAG: hypothetical protein EPN89_14195 [Methylovulum sp.]
MNSRTEYPNQSGVFEQAELDRLLTAALAPIAPEANRHQAIMARLQQRTVQSIAEHAGLLTIRLKAGVWHPVTDGIRFKRLWNGPEGNSVLVEFSAGASLPVHRHNWLEEGIVLRGGLQMGELELDRFDYHVSPAGSRHQSIQSRQGALAYLRGTSLGHSPSVLRELLGGLLPFSGGNAQTVFYGDGGWQQLSSGVFKKELYSGGGMASCFYRLEPGATVPGHQHLKNEECMMLAGEVFLGDILLRAGEFQLAPAGSQHGEAYTDVGALLFVRGAVC